MEEFFKNEGKLKVAKTEKLPYQQIDVIFNHKNVWANLQNPDPAKIHYHIHDIEAWLPLIED